MEASQKGLLESPYYGILGSTRCETFVVAVRKTTPAEFVEEFFVRKLSRAFDKLPKGDSGSLCSQVFSLSKPMN